MVKVFIQYKRVNQWIGHKNIQTTMDYGSPAVEYFDLYPQNWYNHALKQSYGGKHDFPNRQQNRALLGKITPVEVSGPVEI